MARSPLVGAEDLRYLNSYPNDHELRRTVAPVDSPDACGVCTARSGHKHRSLHNRFHLVELPRGAGGTGASHEAVLDDALFERATQAKQTNPGANAARENGRHHRYSLSGPSVCETCGGRLRFHTGRSGRARVYRYPERHA